MKTSPVGFEDLANSVVTVPPLARDASLRIERAENRKIIRHLERGGVTTLMYGGNANFYNIPLSEYRGRSSFSLRRRARTAGSFRRPDQTTGA